MIIATLLLTGAVSYLAGEYIIAVRPALKANRSPKLTKLEIFNRKERILHSTGRISKYTIENMGGTGKEAVDDHVRRTYSGTTFDDYSIGWCHPCYNPITKTHLSGYWSKRYEDQSGIEIFFYTFPEPPEPPKEEEPAPAPEIGWTAADEQNRIESFQHNRLAFWLSPDWGKGSSNMSDPGTQPFWTRKPAAIPKKTKEAPKPTPEERIREAIVEKKVVKTSQGKFNTFVSKIVEDSVANISKQEQDINHLLDRMSPQQRAELVAMEKAHRFHERYHSETPFRICDYQNIVKIINE